MTKGSNKFRDMTDIDMARGKTPEKADLSPARNRRTNASGQQSFFRTNISMGPSGRIHDNRNEYDGTK